MKIKRTVPPVANPVSIRDLLHGFAGIFYSRKYVETFEHELKEHFNVRHVFLVSSGKAALTLILKALQSLSPERKKVLIPAYTCFSVPSSIVKAGMQVSLCDVDMTTLDFEEKLLGESISEDTLCVVPTHLFGIPSNVDRINDICKDKGVFVVEDASQSMGGTCRGKQLGTFGDVGFFSLGRGKNITCGSGGIIITDSDSIAREIETCYGSLENPGIEEVVKEFIQIVIMSIFIHSEFYWLPLRLPFLKLGQTIFYSDFPIKKFCGMKAGILWNWKERLQASNQSRVDTVGYFRKKLHLNNWHDHPVPHLRLPVLLNDQKSRDRIYTESYERGLGIGLMYPSPINEIKEIRDNFSGKVFVSTKTIADNLLTLPTHSLLSQKDREDICELFEKYSKKESQVWG